MYTIFYSFICAACARATRPVSVWFMGGSIEMPDIVNTLMLYDLTFNSFRACSVWIYVHEMAWWRGTPRGRHGTPNLLGECLEGGGVDGAPNVNVHRGGVSGGGGHARDSRDFVVVDGWRGRRWRVRHRWGGSGRTARRHQPETGRLQLASKRRNPIIRDCNVICKLDNYF